MGLESWRPESEMGKGSDIVWLWDNNCYVVEVKHNNQKTLHKKDSAQLHDSIKWATEYYPMYNIIPVTITKDNITHCDKDAHYNSDTLLIKESNVNNLIQNLNNLFLYIIEHKELLESHELLADKLKHFKLDKESFKLNYSTNIKKL
ncbi:hypothetical protein [Acinetobacter lactucae]|uniref:hypothetical protein n=1 Tax=Acinetobacter lactucae TaxID=1785128 RepID=UPI00124D7D3B|nr:hypothetical protein [Acinetobacter lactucae]